MESDSSSQKKQPPFTMSTRAKKYPQDPPKKLQSKKSSPVKKGRPPKSISRVKTKKSLTSQYSTKIFKSFLNFVQKSGAKYYNKAIYKQNVNNQEFDFVMRTQEMELSQTENNYLLKLVKAKIITKEGQFQMQKLLKHLKWFFLYWRQQFTHFIFQVIWAKKTEQWSLKFAQQTISNKRFKNILKFLFLRYQTKKEEKQKKSVITIFSNYLVQLYSLIKQMLESIVKQQEQEKGSQNNEDQQNRQKQYMRMQQQEEIQEPKLQNQEELYQQMILQYQWNQYVGHQEQQQHENIQDQHQHDNSKEHQNFEVIQYQSEHIQDEQIQSEQLQDQQHSQHSQDQQHKSHQHKQE